MINIIRIVWQTVRRITNKILGVRGLNCVKREVMSIVMGLFRKTSSVYTKYSISIISLNVIT